MKPGEGGDAGEVIGQIRFGTKTDKALALVKDRIGLNSGDNITLSPYDVEERVEDFFANRKSILNVPRGNSERDKVNIGLREAVIEDVITRTASSPTFKESLNFLDGTSKGKPVGSTVEITFNPFDGRLADFSKSKDMDSEWVNTVSGQKVKVTFGEGGQISQVHFEGQEGQAGLLKSQMMLMTEIGKHNKSHWNERIPKYEPLPLKGMDMFWTKFKELNI
jgi:hypothetical protein